MTDHLDALLTALRASTEGGTFVKLVLANPRHTGDGPRKILVRPVMLTRGTALSFVYRDATQDVTKNLSMAEAMDQVRTLLADGFGNANLFTTQNNIELVFNEKQRPRLRIRKPTFKNTPALEHNRAKKRPVAGAPYLSLLGVTRTDGAVKKGMEAKYRQINRFIEIMGGLLSTLEDSDPLTVADMGCGKGYLTFALYDYVTTTLKKNARVTGIEVRENLVDQCNDTARAVGFAGLRFECDTIQDAVLGPTDVVIALHACDTATDDALFKAIEARASLIVCAPCCHKEVRPRMHCKVPGLERVLRYGILEERQAELLTDGLRALLLQAAGYKTSVFEFVATEHTAKNIMIAAVKLPHAPDPATVLPHIRALKEAFGIDHQRLETLLARARPASDALG